MISKCNGLNEAMPITELPCTIPDDAAYHMQEPQVGKAKSTTAQATNRLYMGYALGYSLGYAILVCMKIRKFDSMEPEF